MRLAGGGVQDRDHANGVCHRVVPGVCADHGLLKKESAVGGRGDVLAGQRLRAQRCGEVVLRRERKWEQPYVVKTQACERTGPWQVHTSDDIAVRVEVPERRGSHCRARQPPQPCRPCAAWRVSAKDGSRSNDAKHPQQPANEVARCGRQRYVGGHWSDLQSVVGKMV